MPIIKKPLDHVDFPAKPKIGILGFYSMMIFLFTLTIGFIYEWKKGALEWE